MPWGSRSFVTRRVGWLLIGLGFALGGSGVFMVASSVAPALQDSFLQSPCSTPCVEQLELDAGEYLVFEEVGRSRQAGPLSSTRRRPPTITSGDVTVSSAAGEALAVSVPSSSQTIDRNGAIYLGVVTFDVPTSGVYTVSVEAPVSTRVLVAPDFGRTFLKALPGFAVGALGAVLGILGIVVLVLVKTGESQTRRTGR
ncbi:MAG TPA: hypothetical protein VFK41_06355 [Nocardioidaceae bacterium]|nr:hypothetical protein [Nocardioidaceae bacterium]